MNPSNELIKLKKYFEKENISCLDIGANTGQFFYKFKEFFPESYVLMIEANPYCDLFLKKTNGDYRILALSDTKKSLTFNTVGRKPHAKGASFYKEVHYEDNGILKLNINTSTLDDEFLGKKFDIVKIDVQGSELDIIKGGKNFLKNIPLLLIEVPLEEYNIGAPTATDIIDELKNLEFFIVDIIDEHFDKHNRLVQIDLLFSKSIKFHDKNILTTYGLDIV